MTFTVYIWIICFISIYVALFWIIVVSLFRLKRAEKLSCFPHVTVAIPVWNEGRSVIDTLTSLCELDYPEDRLHITVIDDGSSDNTLELARGFAADKKNILVLKNEKNMGKSGTVNRALELSESKFFAVVDADSTVDRDLLKKILLYFEDDNIAAVTTQIKVRDPRTIVEKMQRVEMLFASYIRRMMALIGTLHYTNGVMSVFRTDVLKNAGGFSDKTMTEDLEIAMRLRALGHNLAICEDAFGYTRVPDTMKGLWIQRVRWFRGYIQTCLLHRKLLGNKRAGLLGIFQLPLEISMLMIMLITAGIMIVKAVQALFGLFTVFLYGNGFSIEHISLPGLREIILGMNYKIIFPLGAALIIGLYLYVKAHRHMEENWKYAFSSFSYIFLYPVIRGMQWWHAVFAEVFRIKRRWR